ncbi:MAG TPA: hypothetical protein VGD65_09720 [Chryseosolibacter sp.]
MAAERDFELLDDYLGNRMDEKSRAAFEQKINADQELKAEFELQQKTISAIKKARMAELKGMLNNIPVPAGPTSGVAVGAKVAIWAAVAGLIATGIYLYVDQPAEEVTVPSTEIVTDTEQNENEKPGDTTDANPVGKAHEDSPVVSSQKSSAEQKPVAPPKPGSKAASPKIDVYDPSKELEDGNTEQVNDDLDHSQASVAPTIEVEIDAENKKYSYHYQFKAGKLFLYGPFENEPYEIMEFFNAEKRTLFLYHNQNYYLLKDNSTSLKPLNPIQDTELLNKLKEYRNK